MQEQYPTDLTDSQWALIEPLLHSKVSRGIPRKINLICSRPLVSGCVHEKHVLGIEDIQNFVEDMRP